MFAADESGDPGLDVPGGASRYFSLVLIEYDEEEIRQLLRALRKQQKLPEHFEYHFAQGTSRRDDVRHRFMEAVASSTTTGVGVTVDKRALPQAMQKLGGPGILADQLCSLLLKLPDARLNNATVLIDGNKRGSKRLCQATEKQFRQRVRTSTRTCYLKGVKAAESHRTDGVQVADMIVGAAQHSASKKKFDYLVPLRHKIPIERIGWK